MPRTVVLAIGVTLGFVAALMWTHHRDSGGAPNEMSEVERKLLDRCHREIAGITEWEPEFIGEPIVFARADPHDKNVITGFASGDVLIKNAYGAAKRKYWSADTKEDSQEWLHLRIGGYTHYEDGQLVMSGEI